MSPIQRLLTLTMLMLLTLTARAGSIETLEIFRGATGQIMPGEVIQGHAKYEEQCDKCHVNFGKEHQSTLCLDCHKAIRDDVQSASGFHGRIENIAKRECKSCHSDHLGRDADIVHLDPLTSEADGGIELKKIAPKKRVY